MDSHIPLILSKDRWEIEKGTSLNAVAILTFDISNYSRSKQTPALSLSLS